MGRLPGVGCRASTASVVEPASGEMVVATAMDRVRGVRRARVAIEMEISGGVEPASGEVIADAAMDRVRGVRRARAGIWV